jgi:hypothetical protein
MIQERAEVLPHEIVEDRLLLPSRFIPGSQHDGRAWRAACQRWIISFQAVADALAGRSRIPPWRRQGHAGSIGVAPWGQASRSTTSRPWPGKALAFLEEGGEAQPDFAGEGAPLVLPADERRSGEAVHGGALAPREEGGEARTGPADPGVHRSVTHAAEGCYLREGEPLGEREQDFARPPW